MFNKLKPNTMKKMITLITICLLINCQVYAQSNSQEPGATKTTEVQTQESVSTSDKIKVLNFATFHMGETVDANTVDFDEKNLENQKNANKLAVMLSKFKPTIICVEVPIESQDALNTEFQKYLSEANGPSSYKGEIGLVAFELGRLSKIDTLYGIDSEMEYNYDIVRQIENKIDPTTIQKFYSNPFQYFPELNVDESKLSFFDRMKIGNTDAFLDFLILTNADMLTHVGSENGFEGADEAAKFYQRNLRIFSNLNRIPVTNTDRIFILSGGSHTAFLREFMKRSPKYEMVNTQDYLD